METKLEAEFKSAKDKGEIDLFIVSAFEEKSIDKINFLTSKGFKISNNIDNKYKFLLLNHFSELNSILKENIKSVLHNGQSEYKIEDIKTFKFKGEYGEHNGINQVRTDATFTYDENTNSISRVDRAYSRPEGILLYEKNYLSNGIGITYYEKNENKELIKAKIFNDEIIFNLNSIDTDYSLSEFKERVIETIYSKNIDMFDDDLSNLFYIYPLFQEHNLSHKSSYFINLACGKELQDEKNVENIETIINDSVKKENENKIFICNFAYNNHQVQFLVCNGRTISINTSEPDPLYGVK